MELLPRFLEQTPCVFILQWVPQIKYLVLLLELTPVGEREESRMGLREKSVLQLQQKPQPALQEAFKLA